MQHPSKLLQQPNKEKCNSFRAGHHTRLSRSEVPSSDDGSGQAVAHQVASSARERRLVDLSSSNPIRWRPCADPVQKRDPASGQRKKGLTDQRPLQKGGQKRTCAVPTFACALVKVGTLALCPPLQQLKLWYPPSNAMGRFNEAGLRPHRLWRDGLHRTSYRRISRDVLSRR